ncbi:MAG: DoxX family protein [Proteobacteria bacterium]|nr:DoxX family protein [Pseudomonadota bacterium]
MSQLAYTVARILVPITFIISGWGKLTNVAAAARQLADKNIPIPFAFDAYIGLPKYELLGYGVAALEFFGGIMILLGWKARWAAIALFIFTGLTIYYFHDFWNIADPAQIAAQRTQALKNLSIMGALLMVAVMGSGRYSLDHSDARTSNDEDATSARN